MYLITGISDDPKQNLNLILYNGKTLLLNLEFKSMQLGWFGSLVYGDVTINNFRIMTSPNMLRQFKNIIPFGLSCLVNGNQEPMLKQDFLSKRASLYILNENEVDTIEGVISGEISA